MPRCTYFESDHWVETVTEAARAWDLEDLLERSDLVADTGTFSAEVADAFDRPLSALVLGEVIDEPSVAVPFGDEALAGAWADRWNVDETCPHQAETGDRCCFHADPTETSPSELKAAFLEAIHDPERSAFVGARFGHFDLSEAVIARDFNHPIDLSYASFETLSFRKTTVGTELDCSFAHVSGRLDCRNAEVRGRARFIGLTAGGTTAFTHCDFQGRCSFLKASFHDIARFNYATFGRGTKLREAEFHDDVEFRDVDFRDVVTFEWARVAGDSEFRFTTFESGARFRGATFEGEVDFHDAHFRLGALFKATRFGGLAEFKHVAFVTGTNFEGARFSDDADFFSATFGRRVTFADAVFEQSAEFQRSRFERRGRFRGTRFEGKTSFSRAGFDELLELHDVSFAASATFSRAEFTELDFTDVTAAEPLRFTDAELDGGTIRYESTPETVYDMTGATLGDVRLRFADRNPFELVHIDGTEFDGFQFSDGRHRRYLKRGWRLHGLSPLVAEPADNDRIENTYLKAKNGASKVGDNRAASEFFLKEMKYRRRASFDQLRQGTGLQRASGLARWMVSWSFNLTCGYGERPRNTVLSAAGTVVLFAVLFYLTGVELGGPLDYLLVSLQSFVALILGELPDSGLLSLKVLSSIEAFVGAFFIGLFVFSLTRSIHR